MDHFHRKYLHTGPYLILSILRQNYWIFLCKLFFLLNPKPQFPKMADLSTERFSQTKSFFHTCVNYTVAFSITMGRYRLVKTQKGLCLFVLNYEAAFKRFLSRWGNCCTIFSDRGTNFIGAIRYFDEISQVIDSQHYKNSLHV